MSDDAEQQEEELLVLESVYGEQFARDDASRCCSMRLTEEGVVPQAVLRFHLPNDYPSATPPFCEILAPHITDDVKETLSSELTAQFVPGEVVLFTFIEWAREQGYLWEPPKAPPAPDATAGDDADECAERLQRSLRMAAEPATVADPALAAAEARIIHGEPFTVQRSTFQAHVSEVHSLQEVKDMVAALLQHNKIRAATHNIMAYRIVDSERGTVLQDYDDDGEAAAGGRLLHVLQCADVTNACVVVSRWFGGVLLGPARFMHINNTARQLLEQEGFIVKAGGDGGGKSKGKKAKK